MKYLAALLLVLLALPTLMAQADRRTRILVETNKGKLTLELYNETPRHRDNFIRLVKQGAYDGVAFHRIVRDFVVQGGMLQTKGLAEEQALPEDTLGLTLPAEIMPEHFIHQRGALAAARQSDEVNPERRSSGSQFYIVTGKYHTAFDLEELMQANGRQYTKEQLEAYMLHGGTPSLDGAYTVFGRLIDGWKVVDKMQRVETNDEDRPLKPVLIKRMSILPIDSKQ